MRRHMIKHKGNEIQAYVCFYRRTCCYPNYHIYNMDDSVKYILSPRCCYNSVFGLCSDIVIDVSTHDFLTSFFPVNHQKPVNKDLHGLFRG